MSTYLTSGMGSMPTTYIHGLREGSTLPVFLSVLIQTHRLDIIPKPGSSTMDVRKISAGVQEFE